MVSSLLLDKCIMGRANLEVFSATLSEMAEHDQDLLVVTSDSRGSGKLGPFAEKYPDQIVEVGIAEQNLVGVSAGLASTGKTVFAVSPACFLATRSLEQIKNDVAYSNQPVNLVGISAGVSYGALGSTHHSLHDIAALRAISNIDLVVPADNFETRGAINAAAQSHNPVFLKFGKKALPILPRLEQTFKIGRASTLCSGADVAFIACGEAVSPCYEATLLLKERGINATLISMHTIRPLDKETVVQVGKEHQAIITAEEHSVHGGLGEACASVLMQEGISTAFKIVGIPDEDTVTGSQEEIFKHYGISGVALYNTAIHLMDT